MQRRPFVRIDRLNQVLGVVVLWLNLLVCIPLTLQSIVDGGGRWGYGTLMLPVLLIVSSLTMSAMAAMVMNTPFREKLFQVSQWLLIAISIFSIGFFGQFVLCLVPLLFAVSSLVYQRSFRFFLLASLLVGLIANLVLAKWEFDFHRSLPIIELFANDGIFSRS